MKKFVKIIALPLLAWLPAHAAKAAVCTVSAYKAYVAALPGKFVLPDRRPIRFICPFGQFSAGSDSGLVCAADKTTDRAFPATFEVRLFGSEGASIHPSNGWNISDFDVAGGPVEKRHRRDALVAFKFVVTSDTASRRRVVSTMTLSKEGGDCAKALHEAFGPMDAAKTN